MALDPASPPPPAAEQDDAAVVSQHRHLAGVWAAELLGLIGHAAHDYVRAVAHTDCDDHAGEGLVHRLADDLKNHASAHDIRHKLHHLWDEARRQVRAGPHRPV